MAATERDSSAGSILLAALSLPALMPATAHADDPPADNVAAIRGLYYQDSQPGLQRIKVLAPSAYLQVPFLQRFSLEASTVLDAVSGATPRYYTSVSGASKMHDQRIAEDGHVTYYRSRSAYGIGVSHSKEDDYLSNSYSADARFSTDDNNTTLNLGFGFTDDTINPTNQLVVDARKHSRDWIVGLTQALTRLDLAQIQLGYVSANGYFSDPYKILDNRPQKRDEGTVLVRWNHYVEKVDGTLRLSYRYYRDSYQIRSHTLQVEWVQPLSPTFKITPMLRYYSQSAAYFYVDPVVDANGEQLPPTIPDDAFSSLDQRMSAFGSLAYRQSLEWQFLPRWTASLSGEWMDQRGSLRFTGNGSPDLAPFHALTVQAGLSVHF